MTRLMDMELISTQMEPHILENGLKINNTERVQRRGQTVPDMKVSIKMVKRMVLVH